MERRYHRCGYSVWVSDSPPNQSNPLIFYKELAPDAYAAITTCPQCSMELTEATVRPTAFDAAKTLQAWVLIWPELRRQIEFVIADYEQHEPGFYGYHAACDILEFEQALCEIADLVRHLAEPATSR